MLGRVGLCQVRLGLGERLRVNLGWVWFYDFFSKFALKFIFTALLNEGQNIETFYEIL